MPFITQGKTNIKYILIVIILAAIAGGGILGYMQWWTTRQEEKLTEFPELKILPKILDETADWKIYENKEYNFAIDYPKSWYAYPNQFGGLEEIATFSETKYKQYYGTEDHKKIGENYGIVHIEYIKNNDLEKQIENIDKLIKALGRGPISKIETSSVEEINVDGIKGYKISFSGKGYMLDEDFTNIFYLILHKNNEGTLKFEGIFAGNNKEEYEKYAELFNQMLSTFKFIEPEKMITKEESCVNSGGTVETSLCCESASDLPNSCLIGACGCSPENSHQIKICDCGEGKCFNGTECVVSQNP